MIGCGVYTDTLSCMQYVQDVKMMKVLLILVLLIGSIIMIYYSRTSHYKKLTTEFISFKTFFRVPIIFSYVFLGFIFYVPFLLSINISIDAFMNYIYAFVVPVVAWMSMMCFLIFIDWMFQRFGFENFKHFIRSARGKR